MNKVLIKESVVKRVQSILRHHSVSYCAANTSLTLRKIYAIKEGKYEVVDSKEKPKKGMFSWKDFKI